MEIIYSGDTSKECLTTSHRSRLPDSKRGVSSPHSNLEHQLVFRGASRALFGRPIHCYIITCVLYMATLQVRKRGPVSSKAWVATAFKLCIHSMIEQIPRASARAMPSRSSIRLPLSYPTGLARSPAIQGHGRRTWRPRRKHLQR
jgi:hypothetical protein